LVQLPELRYDQANRQLNLLGGTRWTGFSEIGHYQKKLADFIIEDLEEEQATASLARQNEIDSLLANREQKRVHTHQQLQYHFQPQPWLNSSITASVGALQYWDLRNAQSAENNEFTQLYSSAQIDLNTNFHRRNDDVYIDWLDIDGLVHNIQPYAQLSILGNQQYGEFTPDVDTRLINTRPLQLQAGQQDQYDSLDSWSILRTGIRQTLITRQNNKSHNWLSWNSYIDYLFDDPIADRTLSNWYNDLNFTPSTWTNLSWDSQLPVDSTGFTQSNFSWEFRPMRTVTLRFNHFLLNDHPFLNDADFLSTRTYIRLNDEIGVSTEHRYDRRSQDLIYQEYGYHRQMESWILSFNFFNRNNNQRSEFGISVGLQLKAFPQFRAPFRLGN